MKYWLWRAARNDSIVRRSTNERAVSRQTTVGSPLRAPSRHSSSAPRDRKNEAVSAARLERTVRDLAAMGSRMPGLPGNAAAARYVADALKRAGVADVAFEPFDVVVPVPTNGGTGAHLDLSTGERVAIHPLWPNLIRTCQTPPAGVSGPLIDAGMGALSAYNGHETLGSIVLLEFNSGRAWYDARLSLIHI